MRSNGRDRQEEWLCSLACLREIVESFLLDEVGRVDVSINIGRSV